MKKSGIILGLLFLFLLSFITAQPPFMQTGAFTEGYSIKVPQEGNVLQSQNYDFAFHVFNISNGIPIDDTSTSCYFHLYNQSGEHILQTDATYSPSNIDNEWEVFVLGGNFSTPGDYAYIIQCNSTVLGGYESVGFTVTNAKVSISTSEAIIYVLLTLGVFLLFALSLYFMVTTPYGNKVNQKGAVIKITKAKYFKLLLIALTYVFFLWLLNVLIGVSSNFVSLSLYFGFISFIFDILIRLNFIVFAVIFVIGLFELVRDMNIYNEIKKLGSALR